MRDFRIEISKLDWDKLRNNVSVTRKLSDLFWLKLPWKLMHSELRQINVLDIGCGSGEYGKILQSLSGNRINKYKGIDLVLNDNWKGLQESYNNFTFEQINSPNIVDFIPKDTNLIISQSSFEHIDEDLSYFNQLSQFIQSHSNKNIIQIHLLPASITLFLTLIHGIRQYNQRTISKITKFFNPFSYSVLFKLGGNKCNSLHFNYITIPIVRKKRNLFPYNQDYNLKVLESIKGDMLKSQKFPNYYALIIHTNAIRNIFQL